MSQATGRWSDGRRVEYSTTKRNFGCKKIDALVVGDANGSIGSIYSLEWPQQQSGYPVDFTVHVEYVSASGRCSDYESLSDLYDCNQSFIADFDTWIHSNASQTVDRDKTLLDTIESFKISTSPTSSLKTGCWIRYDGEESFYGILSEFIEHKEDYAHEFQIVQSTNCLVTPVDVRQDSCKDLTSPDGLEPMRVSQASIEFVCDADQTENFAYKYLQLKVHLKSLDHDRVQNRLDSVGTQYWVGHGNGIYSTLRTNRNEHRKISHTQFCGPTLWTHVLSKEFEKIGVELDSNGCTLKSLLSLKQLVDLGIPSECVVRTIEGDKAQGTRDLHIYPKDVMFVYSELTYCTKIQYFVKKRRGKNLLK